MKALVRYPIMIAVHSSVGPHYDLIQFISSQSCMLSEVSFLSDQTVYAYPSPSFATFCNSDCPSFTIFDLFHPSASSKVILTSSTIHVSPPSHHDRRRRHRLFVVSPLACCALSLTRRHKVSNFEAFEVKVLDEV